MSQTFRSRDEQMADLADCLIKDGSGFHRSTIDYTAYSFIEEAEVRGAAEERAKAAEGQEPVAWQYEAEGLGEWINREVGYGPYIWRLCCSHYKPDMGRPSYRNLSPLYDRPANVAALEARVKELEGVCRHVVWTVEEHGLGSRGHDSAVQAARAALTREGGE
ncbi:MAG: hypothetical protein ABF617_08060 [Gluconobacter japonicus]|uniref:hypothetical protein n=1 Tax=Gluconobacter japonicus TaxID=376620 RepID=UPI0039EB6C07